MAAITVVGGINIDIEGRPDDSLVRADSNPGKVSVSVGGVGRNIVENIARLGGDVAMISLTGDDVMGQNAKAQLAALGVDVSGIQNVPGDAFSAAILMGHVSGLSAEETAKMGIACASLAMEAQTAVNPAISMKAVRARMGDLGRV